MCCDREKNEDGSVATLGSRLSTNVKLHQTAPGFELLSLREKKVLLCSYSAVVFWMFSSQKASKIA